MKKSMSHYNTHTFMVKKNTSIKNKYKNKRIIIKLKNKKNLTKKLIK